MPSGGESSGFVPNNESSKIVMCRCRPVSCRDGESQGEDWCFTGSCISEGRTFRGMYVDEERGGALVEKARKPMSTYGAEGESDLMWVTVHELGASSIFPYLGWKAFLG